MQGGHHPNYPQQGGGGPYMQGYGQPYGTGYLSQRPGYPAPMGGMQGQPVPGMPPPQNMHGMPMHQGMAPGQYPPNSMGGHPTQPQPQGNGSAMNPAPHGFTSNGAPMPMNGMQHMSNGMNPYSQQFMPSQAYSYEQPAASEQPPTDEEQEWLEQQMERNRPAEAPAQAAETEDEPALDDQTLVPEATPANEAPSSAPVEGDYDDVMKMIEENRRRNEAKRAAQSARNAEIIAAYEARMNGSQQG